jgi:hypothetical protein
VDKWKSDLKSAFEKQDRKSLSALKKKRTAEEEIKIFLADVVKPAFKEIKSEMGKHNRRVEIAISSRPSLQIYFDNNLELQFEIEFRNLHLAPQITTQDKNGNYSNSELTFRSGAQDFTIHDISKNEIIDFIVKKYIDWGLKLS